MVRTVCRVQVRHVLLLVLGALATWLAGCVALAPEQLAPASPFERLRGLQGPSGPDVVQLGVALLERPAGDPYFNDGIWNSADEQVLTGEVQGRLADNGLRVGQIGGIPPATLQALLTSERSCVDPRRLRVRAGKPTTLTIGPSVSSCGYQIVRHGQSSQVTLQQAQCTLSVVPTLPVDGRVSLRFTPVIRHGKATMALRPAADRTGWERREERPEENYDELSWEVKLAANEYIIIGAESEHPETLGSVYFVRAAEQPPVQRLLVIRAARMGAETDPPADSAGRHAVPLAVQAGASAITP